MSSTSYSLIFAILTTGYLALKFSNYTRYKVIKYNNQELFLASGVAGTIIYFLGGIGHKLIVNSSIQIHGLLEWLEFIDSNAHPSLVGFLATLVVIFLSNFWFQKSRVIDKEIMLRNDGIEILLLESLKSLQKEDPNNYSLVAITLTNYKVYIGLVTTHFFSPHGNESFLLWPIFSGFRKKDDNQLIANVTYVYEYRKLLHEFTIEELDKSYVAIPIDKVISVSDFDEEIYYDQLVKYESDNIAKSPKDNDYPILKRIIDKTIKYIDSI